MIQALVLKADGSIPVITTIPSQKETFGIIKDTISSPHGTWFDCVCGENFRAYVNDTGLIDGLPLNPIASIVFGQVICGDVIFFGSYTPAGQWDGEEHDVPECVIDSVKMHWSLLNTNVDARNARLEIENANERTNWSPTTDEFLQLIRSNGVSSEVSR